ncbi:MAG: hypothetical protein ACRYGP_02125 [Janthinobacterium lividum]
MAYDDLSTTPVDTGRQSSPRSVTAFFDTDEAAGHARRDLVAAGVPDGDVRIAGGEAALADAPHPHGFWENLKEFFIPDEDRHLYAEGLRRGGVALSVETDSAAYDRVLEILDRDGAVDMEERSAGWREEGWSAFGGGASLGEREMAYTPASSSIGGFTASRADQPLFDGPMDNAAIEPGSVVPDAPKPSRLGAAAPDTAYAASAPGMPSIADIAADRTAEPGSLQPSPSLSSPLPPTPTRDLSHGRTRVRSYVGELSSNDMPRD